MSMEKLTTEIPQGNMEAVLNLCYAKNGTTWVGGYGQRTDQPDIRLNDLLRKMISTHNLDIDAGQSGEALDEDIAGCLMEGVETPEGVAALFHTTAWAFAELRARLKEYEDAEAAGLLVRLPCAVGTTVYTVENFIEEMDDRLHFPKMKRVAPYIKATIVDGFDIRKDEIFGPGWVYYELNPIGGIDGEWYPTREQAEAALTRLNIGPRSE